MLSSLLTITTLLGLTLAAPADNARRANDLGHKVRQIGIPYGTAPYSLPPVPTGTRPPYPYPTGAYSTGRPYTYAPIPTGTAPSVPYPTGDASCPVNGAVVCGPTPEYFGLCNWGQVVWQRVADGTNCVDGQIVGTGIYAVPQATAT